MKMKQYIAICIISLVTLMHSSPAQAIVISTSDWESGGTSSRPVLRVTSVFYTAAEIAGTSLDRTPSIEDNLFRYSMTNIYGYSLPVDRFGLTNLDAVSGVMFGPDGWETMESPGPGYSVFLWQPFNEGSVALDPDNTLSGLELFTPAACGLYTGFDPLVGLDHHAWTMFWDSDTGFLGWSVDGPALGPIAGSTAVPEPASFLLFGSGLVGLGLVRFRVRKK